MKKPVVAQSAYIAESADLVGEVFIGEECSIWHHATLRGDVSAIKIGDGSNIQDNCVLHGSTGTDTIVGENSTVGHSAILHSCTIGNNTLIGMGAIVLDGSVVGDDCLIGAGALVTKNKVIPDGSLVIGRPGKVVRSLTKEEIAGNALSAKEYKISAKDFKNGEIAAYER